MTLEKTFSERVVDVVVGIPEGRVMTYGDVVRAAGGSSMVLAQSITHILSKSDIKDIPYHRVVYADGRVWVDDKCREERMKIYKKEGITLDKKDRIIEFADVRLEV